MSDITAELLSMLRRHLQFLGDADELALQSELSELGLDSMGAIGLLIELETSFAITFPDSCALIGLELCTQGGSVSFPLQIGLTNAIDIRIGVI